MFYYNFKTAKSKKTQNKTCMLYLFDFYTIARDMQLTQG